MGIIDRYRELTDRHGVPGAAKIIATEHAAGQYDAIDGFMQIESADASFWTMDSLAHDVVGQVKKLDVTKTIHLCVKLEKLEGDDLAAGRVYDAFETYLSSHADDARLAFDLVIEKPEFQPALPCVSRALNRTEATYVLSRLLESKSLAAIFSMQFCVTDDEPMRSRVQDALRSACGSNSTDNMIRAAYLTAKAWRFEDLREQLLVGGSAGVLRAAVFELTNSEEIFDENTFKKQLGHFSNVEKENEFLWDRIDWALQQNYLKFGNVCLDFAKAHLDKAKFEGFSRFLAMEIGTGDLLRVLILLLSAGSPAEEYFAFRIASRVELNRKFEVTELEVESGSRSYAFRKCLGWLFGRKEMCLPLVLALVTEMDRSEWEEVADCFYDPVCLHYTDSMERLMSEGLVFADKQVEAQSWDMVQRAAKFYREMNERGPCNELHPNAEMVVAAGKRESEMMAKAYKAAQEKSIFSALCSHSTNLLHGGKMICYSSIGECEIQRQVIPLHHQTISVQVPRLTALSGTFLEDRLAVFRMEGRS